MQEQQCCSPKQPKAADCKTCLKLIVKLWRKIFIPLRNGNSLKSFFIILSNINLQCNFFSLPPSFSLYLLLNDNYHNLPAGSCNLGKAAHRPAAAPYTRSLLVVHLLFRYWLAFGPPPTRLVRPFWNVLNAWKESRGRDNQMSFN